MGNGLNRCDGGGRRNCKDNGICGPDVSVVQSVVVQELKDVGHLDEASQRQGGIQLLSLSSWAADLEQVVQASRRGQRVLDGDPLKTLLRRLARTRRFDFRVGRKRNQIHSLSLTVRVREQSAERSQLVHNQLRRQSIGRCETLQRHSCHLTIELGFFPISKILVSGFLCLANRPAILRVSTGLFSSNYCQNQKTQH